MCLLLAGLLLCALTATATAQPVRIAGVSHVGDLPTFVAEEHGFFAAAGIEADITRLSDGRRALQRLRAGDVDFALMALTPLVLDRLADDRPNGDDDPVILASLVQSPHLNQIVTLDGTGIRHPADLTGRRLGLTRGTNAEFHWWMFARFQGLDPSAVETVDLAKDRLDGALLAGRIDAAVLWQPWTARLRARAGDRLRPFRHGSLYSAHWVLVTRRATVSERAHPCAAVLRAYARAIRAIERDPAAAIEGFHDALGLGPEVAAAEAYQYGFQLHLDWSVLVGLGQQFDWAVSTDRGGAGMAPEVLSMVAPGPLRAAAPSAVNVAADLLDAERTP